MYLYQKIIYKSYDNVAGLSDAEKTQNDSDKSDFETNHKGTAIKVSDVFLAETTFIEYLTYAQFEAKIVSPITWADVKYTEANNHYELNLLSEN